MSLTVWVSEGPIADWSCNWANLNLREHFNILSELRSFMCVSLWYRTTALFHYFLCPPLLTLLFVFACFISFNAISPKIKTTTATTTQYQYTFKCTFLLNVYPFNIDEVQVHTIYRIRAIRVHSWATMNFWYVWQTQLKWDIAWDHLLRRTMGDFSSITFVEVKLQKFWKRKQWKNTQTNSAINTRRMIFWGLFTLFSLKLFDTNNNEVLTNLWFKLNWGVLLFFLIS